VIREVIPTKIQKHRINNLKSAVCIAAVELNKHWTYLSHCATHRCRLEYAVFLNIPSPMDQILYRDLPHNMGSDELFERLRDLPDAIWLDSGKPRGIQGRFDIISACPDTVVETINGVSSITNAQGTTESLEDPFEIAKRLLDELQPIKKPDYAPFYCGLIGYFGYDLGTQIMGVEQQTAEVADLPDMRIGRYLWSLVIDHQSGKNTLLFHPKTSVNLREEIAGRLLAEDYIASSENTDFKITERFKETVSQQQYQSAVDRIKDYIAEGDCYQTNYAQHFSALFQGDLLQAYRQLRQVIPSPYSVFWQWGSKALLSMSPERFIKTSTDGSEIRVETKPIKGTVLRGKTVSEDQENAIQLMNSQKDRAENLMIVDLLRNDLGKTCVPGSITVPRLFDLESFANVHHLVSTVQGVLSTDKSALDLLKGCFPGGSITGAPKKRSMEIIEELEPVKRSAYCGAIGYFCASGQMDTNIAIRTLVADNQRLHCWGGGGIVADSAAESEYQESINKIRLILDTLETL
jgi:para-aminobenzoate synthetase component 1